MSRTIQPARAELSALSIGSTRPRWSVARLAGGLVLGVWAGMFWFLLLADRVPFYLSTRTSWVVPIGAVLLTAAAIGRLGAARSIDATPLLRRDAIVMALMLVPVLIIMVLPPATLGSFSASKKTSFSSLNYSTIYGEITDDSPITFLSIAAGQTSTPGARALAKRAGSDVDLVGFVTRFDSTPTDEFYLTRYVVTCCVSDATITQVRVVDVPAGTVEIDEWVEVKGQIYPLGREAIVTQTSITPAETPEVPYLTP